MTKYLWSFSGKIYEKCMEKIDDKPKTIKQAHQEFLNKRKPKVPNIRRVTEEDLYKWGE